MSTPTIQDSILSLGSLLSKSTDFSILSDSTSLLERFIQECLADTNKDPLQNLITQVRYALSHQEVPPDDVLYQLNALESLVQKPITIAIVGQFSSGKSTFLNALLGREILPSGITPITSKVCEICHGEDYELEARYHNGSIKSKPLEFLHTLNELENAHIKDFRLYAPNPLLEHIRFLDTPGFNSQNEADTDTTNAILEEVEGIIWLSLIDNVGKQSEKDILQNHIRKYAAKSLCVLNQKDRLKDEQEIATSLQYAKEAFRGLFSEVVAISAKQALAAEDKTLYAHSNMQSVLDFIHTHLAPNAASLKKQKILRSLKTLLIQALYHTHKGIFALNNLATMLEKQDGKVRFCAMQSGLEKHFNTLFLSYDSELENLAQSIFASLDSQEIQLPLVVKNKFGLRTQITQTKSVPLLPKDTLISKLCSEESQYVRDFRKLGFAMSDFSMTFGALLAKEQESLKDKVFDISTNKSLIKSLSQAKFHSLQETLFAIVRDYENAGLKAVANLQSELIILRHCITTNYRGAITLALTKLDSTMQYALKKHLQNPKDFALFIPTLENVREELNISLHFLLFQDKLFLQNALYKKALWEISEAYAQCFERFSSMLEPFQDALMEYYNILKSELLRIKQYK